MSKPVIFWGATGQAKVLKECLRDSDSELIAVFDNNLTLKSPFPEVPLYYGERGFIAWRQDQDLHKSIFFLVAIGGDKGKARLEIQNYLEQQGLIPLSVKHPTAFVAENVTVAPGTQVLAQSSVCVETVIERACIVNTGAIIDHESYLEVGVHICPGAHLAGCVRVGQYATVGTGAIILPRLEIGEGAFVGAGAVVTKNVPPYTVVVGNPARIVREINYAS